MTIRLHDNPNYLALSFQPTPKALALVKSLPGRMFLKRPGASCWLLPLADPLTLQSAQKLISLGFIPSQDVLARLSTLRVEYAYLSALKSNTALQEDLTGLPSLPLFAYQRIGAAFLAKSCSLSGGALLADRVGLGKTIQTLAACEMLHPANPRILWITLASLKVQTGKEMNKFLPQRQVLPVVGKNKPARLSLWDEHTATSYPNYTIVNYELLTTDDFDRMCNISWDVIVCDEATRLSNQENKQYQRLQRLHSTHRIALTGTPVSNSPLDIFGILDWCKPGCLGRFSEFCDRYVVRDMFGGILSTKNLEHLASRVAPHMIRRDGTEPYLALDIPEVTTTDVVFPLSPAERTVYDQVRVGLLFDIEKDLINKVNNPVGLQNTLTRLGKLQEITDSLALLGESQESSKLEVLKELLSTVLSDPSIKVIVFTKFERMAVLLQAALPYAKCITGSNTPLERAETIHTFEHDPSTRVLIGTAAIQFGLNLQFASVVIHYEQPFSVAGKVQRLGRVQRIGQRRQIVEYNLLAENTVDEKVYKKLGKKQGMSDTILGGDIIELLENS